MPAYQAIVNGEVIAETAENQYETVDGNIYFPPDSVKMEFLTHTNHHTTCGYKGVADYYTIKAGGKELTNAAWTYKKSKMANIENYIAFYLSKGVQVKQIVRKQAGTC